MGEDRSQASRRITVTEAAEALGISVEAVRRYAGTDVLDIARVRYLAQERGRGALAVWVDKHPHEYARGVLYSFRTD